MTTTSQQPAGDVTSGMITAHLQAEADRDLERMVATVSADVAYEFPLQGVRFVGRDAARRFYSGSSARAAADRGELPQHVQSHRWESDGALVIEARNFPVIGDDGSIATASIGTVIEASADGVTHERMYTTDAAFRSLTRHVSDLLEPM